MSNSQLSLLVMPDKIAICQMDKDAIIPSWATSDSFFAIVKTDDELSVVCSASSVPDGVKSDKEWRAFKVEGTLDFSLIGVIASLSNPLAAAKISIFVISTFNTDYFLVKNVDCDKAITVLSTFCNIKI